MQALTAARESLFQRRQDGAPEADPSAMEQQQADALALLAETALHHGIDPGTTGEHYQVVVHVDAAVLADADQPGQRLLEEGARVSAETSQRIACDASRVVMRHDADGRLLEVGAHAHHSAGATPGAPAPRPRVPLPGLPRSLRPGPSHPPLGSRRADNAIQPHAAVPSPSSRHPRGRIPG
jgi:hypothetical protein